MENSKRLTKLDGLRGILSLIVALNHSFLVVAIPSFANVWGQDYFYFHDLQAKIQQLFMILGNGGVAVTLFFILSGLVLGQSLSRINFDLRGLTAFIVKRLLRLYPVYVFLILLTALYMRFGFTYTAFPQASAWYNWWMNFNMTFKEFFYNFLFFHTYLGGVTWTLRVIVIASFIFPALYLVYKKTTAWMDLMVIVLLVWAAFSIFIFPDFRDLRYLYMFYGGLCLPKFAGLFKAIPHRIIAWSIVPAVILMLVIRYLTDEYAGAVVETVIGWFLIGLMVYNSTTIFNWLDHYLMQFFGKISYSLYLIHFSVLYVLARVMFLLLPDLPYADHYLAIHAGLFLVSLPVATLISFLVYRYVELPSVRLASAVNRKILNS